MRVTAQAPPVKAGLVSGFGSRQDRLKQKPGAGAPGIVVVMSISN
jgi:hypothetical protein